MSVGSRQRVEPVPLHAQKYLSEGYTLPITRVMQIHLNYSHILVKTLTALEPATSHFMRNYRGFEPVTALRHTAALEPLFQTF